ncbi:zinc finger protein 76-like [Scleropages formosus]|uniref:Zinc finger protein 76-like n=1 Tax=Scleropages formosus TaxID=113540 RepID=A0A0N8JW79_SCLFO|nr:zinc finger protein 76-like [Scleropages formosus]
MCPYFCKSKPLVGTVYGNLVEGDTIQLEDGTTAYIQQVTVQQKEALPFEDGQVVQLEDGSTAYIHHTPKEGYDPSAVEAVQLEDGSTAYIHHPVTLQASRTILTVQPGGTLEELTREQALDPDTISTLEQYASKEAEDSISNGARVLKEMDSRVEHTTVQHINLLGTSCDQDLVMSPTQVMIEEKSWASTKAQQTTEKSFRCDYEGCGRLYTTAHHLKVSEIQSIYCNYTCGTWTEECSYCYVVAIFTLAEVEAVEPPHKQPRLAFLEGGESKEEASQVMVTDNTINSQVALITQDRGQQVSLSHEELQALGTAITMVTQDGTTITVPANQDTVDSTGQHTVTMVARDGKELQPVAIVTSDGMTGGSGMTSPSYQQVALLATANGTQIAVQLEDQQTLEEAISMATAAIQQGSLSQDGGPP